MLKETDPQVFDALQAELKRQQTNLELIASENFCSRAVLEAAGSVLTNKYAEGYPGRRYYGGCEEVDVVEQLAVERAKELFAAEHANVQPHAGSQANMAVYFACCRPGDTVMGLDLGQGGHLTHGSPANFSGCLYRVVSYGVRRDTETIDYDQLRELARKERPRLIVSGATAYPRIIDFKAIGQIAEEVGAYHVADIAHIGGLVAAGVHPSPVPYAHFVTATTHKTLRGPRGAFILCREELAPMIDKAVFPGLQGGPLMHIIAAKAVCFHEALQSGFREYAEQIVKNARRLGECLAERGYRLVSGGTDNHLVLVDLSGKGMTGKRAQQVLQAAGITVNKNLVPFDERSPVETSGIRIGTAAVTTRGMKEDQMELIAGWIDRALSHPDESPVWVEIREEVRSFCAQFPLFPDEPGQRRLF